MDKNASAMLVFTGTAVSCVGYRDESCGTARVYLDGSLVATVDTFASPSKAQTVIFSKNGLSAGTHSITIEATGRKSGRSGGTWIWLDAFDVSP